MTRGDDFTGFSFNGVHSSTLGVVRVSNGNRHEVNILPFIKDTSVEVPGGDGHYFYRTNYKKYDMTLNIAFDEMDERQFRFLRRFYLSKGLYQLILDENPYKIYIAKGKGLSNIKFVPFGASNNRRYAGEATLSFEIYDGLSKSRFKFKDDYTIANIAEWNDVVGDYTVRQVDFTEEDPTNTGVVIFTEEEGVNSKLITEEKFYDFNNLNEWDVASGLQERGNYDTFYVDGARGCFDLVNPGDAPAPYNLRLYFLGNGLIPDGSATIVQNGQTVSTVTWEGFEQASRDARTNIAVDEFIEINTKERIVKGFDRNQNRTGRYYINHFDGDFGPVPIGESKMIIEANNVAQLKPYIYYDYLYY